MRLPPRLTKIVFVEPLQHFVLRLTFDDGFVRTVDLESWLDGPIFEPLRASEAYFRTVHLDGGTIAWSNGADIDADVLRYDFLKPAGMKQGVGAITISASPVESQKTSRGRSSPRKTTSKPARARTRAVSKKS